MLSVAATKEVSSSVLLVDQAIIQLSAPYLHGCALFSKKLLGKYLASNTCQVSLAKILSGTSARSAEMTPVDCNQYDYASCFIISCVLLLQGVWATHMVAISMVHKPTAIYHISAATTIPIMTGGTSSLLTSCLCINVCLQCHGMACSHLCPDVLGWDVLNIMLVDPA